MKKKLNFIINIVLFFLKIKFITKGDRKMSMQRLVIAWDLDGTLIEPSKERIKITNGVFDIDFWISHATEEFIMKDKLLPLSEIYYAYQKAGFTQICVTARDMGAADKKFLKEHNFNFDFMLHRENSKELDHVLKSKKLSEFFHRYGLIPFEYFDDKQSNLEIAEKFGFRTFHATYMSQLLRPKGRSL